MNSRKKVFSILRGSFSQDGITDFVRELVGKGGVIIPLKKESLPTIETIEPWDGQDGQVGIDWDNRLHYNLITVSPKCPHVGREAPV